jgi:hypothetical protein
MVCMGMGDYCLFYRPPRVNKKVCRRTIQSGIGEFENSQDLVNKPILPNTNNLNFGGINPWLCIGKSP